MVFLCVSPFRGLLAYDLSLGMTTHQESIQSGGEGPTDALLQQAQRHETFGTSENSPESADGNDLNTDMSPLLRAAQCGDSKAFSSLIYSPNLSSIEVSSPY